MTSENRLIVDLDDVSSFVLECRHEDCLATIALPANKPLESATLQRCPVCYKDWVGLGGETGMWVNLTGLIGRVAERNRDGAFNLRLGLASDVCEGREG